MVGIISDIMEGLFQIKVGLLRHYRIFQIMEEIFQIMERYFRLWSRIYSDIMVDISD